MSDRIVDLLAGRLMKRKAQVDEDILDHTLSVTFKTSEPLSDRLRELLRSRVKEVITGLNAAIGEDIIVDPARVRAYFPMMFNPSLRKE